MISLGNLRTSQIESMAVRLSQGVDVEEFLLAAKRFLSTLPLDGGADDDLIFMTGKRLTSHGIWNYVPALSLRDALQGAFPEAVNLFLEKAPLDYRQNVLGTNGEAENFKPPPKSGKKRQTGNEGKKALANPRFKRPAKEEVSAFVEIRYTGRARELLAQSASVEAVEAATRHEFKRAAAKRYALKAIQRFNLAKALREDRKAKEAEERKAKSRSPSHSYR